ncbi:MAG: CocE/NonD family hydrolase [Deltaproteobacteria bacterium]|nr:CocE/NonD family hydrolase [Deltaproteobacteria bacterium]
MRDNVRLATDIYLPTSGAGPWPVVLHRTPYGKAGFGDAAKNLQGAQVASIAQDTRGRFDSEGTDCIFGCDGNGTLKDGLDTMLWLQQQPFFNGKLVTWGGSATGIVQYMAATASPPDLTAMWVQVATPTLYDHILFQGGVFRKELLEGWLKAQGSEFFLQDIAAHPLNDSFWAPVQTANAYGAVQVPAMHWGGWYDIFTQGTIDAFVGYQHQGGAGAKGTQKLVMGPWTHGGIGTVHQGELTYPSNAAGPPAGSDQILLTWLSHYLGLQPNQAAIDAIPAVQYYVMGAAGEANAPGNVWRSANDWPVPAAPIRQYLHSQGLLAEECPSASDPPSLYTYDPSNPSPTLCGGNLTIPAGPCDQTSAEARSDIVVFSTPVLTSPMEITGRIKAHLWVSADVPDTDVAVRMTDVYPDQRSMLVQDGILRLATRGKNDSLQMLASGEVIEAVIDLWSTSIIINAGHRLRISVTSSNSPRFRPSPNDGTSYGAPSNPVPAHVILHHSADRPSYIELPNPQRKESEVVVCGAAGAGGSGGSGGSGGASGSAGMAGTGAAGSGTDASFGPDSNATDAGGSGLAPAGTADDGGCGCRTSSGSTQASVAGWLLVAVGWLRRVRESRRSAVRRQ